MIPPINGLNRNQINPPVAPVDRTAQLAKSFFQKITRCFHSRTAGVLISGVGIAVAVILLCLKILTIVYFSPLVLLLAIGLTILLVNKGYRKIFLECRALYRFYEKPPFGMIELNHENLSAHNLYLGALPNSIHSSSLPKNIRAVLSLNEDWELEPTGLSVPYQAEDYQRAGIEYLKIDAQDHVPLTLEQLDQAAEWIHDQLQKGDVYVHCVGGKGRSAMAIAAYLIKYDNKTPQEAIATIKKARPSSSIQKKIERLRDFNFKLSRASYEQSERCDLY